jgi:signal transduction histidine kinase
VTVQLQAGQSLSALKLCVGRLRRELDGHAQHSVRFEEMDQLIDGVLDDLHRLAIDLRPISLDRYGLVPALQQYVEFYRRQGSLDVDLVTIGMDEQRLPAELETAVYRVVQEALTNVLRHAKAQHVGVLLERRDGRVVAIVEDDGLGFDVAEAQRCGRLGLVGMRERAEMLGGTLTIESAPGEGTTVYFCTVEEGARI